MCSYYCALFFIVAKIVKLALFPGAFLSRDLGEMGWLMAMEAKCVGSLYMPENFVYFTEKST
jgi:hypothetical protein